MICFRKDQIETEDSERSTELSVIDRFILSGELTPEELVQETYTVFTSVSITTLKYRIQTEEDSERSTELSVIDSERHRRSQTFYDKISGFALQ